MQRNGSFHSILWSVPCRVTLWFVCRPSTLFISSRIFAGRLLVTFLGPCSQNVEQTQAFPPLHSFVVFALYQLREILFCDPFPTPEAQSRILEAVRRFPLSFPILANTFRPSCVFLPKVRRFRNALRDLRQQKRKFSDSAFVSVPQPLPLPTPLPSAPRFEDFGEEKDDLSESEALETPEPSAPLLPSSLPSATGPVPETSDGRNHLGGLDVDAHFSSDDGAREEEEEHDFLEPGAGDGRSAVEEEGGHLGPSLLDSMEPGEGPAIASDPGEEVEVKQEKEEERISQTSGLGEEKVDDDDEEMEPGALPSPEVSAVPEWDDLGPSSSPSSSAAAAVTMDDPKMEAVKDNPANPPTVTCAEDLLKELCLDREHLLQLLNTDPSLNEQIPNNHSANSIFLDLFEDAIEIAEGYECQLFLFSRTGIGLCENRCRRINPSIDTFCVSFLFFCSSFSLPSL